MRILNKYIDAIERIGKRMKKDTLVFDEIKDIIVRVEAKYGTAFGRIALSKQMYKGLCLLFR
jgi:hypothetical protein